MADDKATPTEPTPTCLPCDDGNTAADNAASAAITIGRPTPSPDQLLLPASSTKSDSTCSPHVGDIEIGVEQHGATTTVDAAAAAITVGRPLPSSSTASNSPSNSRLLTVDEQSSINSTTSPDGKQDASSKSNDSDTKEDSFVTTPSPFKKQLAALASSAAAAAAATSNDAYNEKKDDDTTEVNDNGNNNTTMLSPPLGELSTPSVNLNINHNNSLLLSSFPPSGGSLFASSNFGMGSGSRSDASGNALLSESLIETPDMVGGTLPESSPSLVIGGSGSNNFANITDYEVVGREVVAAAATASAMLGRSDGFESGALTLPPHHQRTHQLPIADVAAALTNTTAATLAVARGSGQFASSSSSHQPSQQDHTFPLPPYVQAHLDETYTASTYVFPQPNDQGDGNTYYQVTAYRPRRSDDTTAGDVSPVTSSRANAASAATDNYRPANVASLADVMSTSRGKTLAQLALLPVQPPSKKRKSAKRSATKSVSAKSNARQLPLRKRKVPSYSYDDTSDDAVDDDDDEYTLPPAITGSDTNKKQRREMIRHTDNRRYVEDGIGRVTCKCKNSKCLKLYCDCFQQGKICAASCQCKGCLNTKDESSQPKGKRFMAIKAILERRPDAFQPRTKDSEEGCRCKKNRCLKKYCICFNQGMECDSRCSCKNCGNQPGRKQPEVSNVVMPNVLAEFPVNASAFDEAPDLPEEGDVYTFAV